MSDTDRVRRFQAALDGIADEAEARNELAGRRVTEAFTASQEELGRQSEALDEAVREASEQEPIWPAQPPPRHRRATAPEFDDEDFSNTDWLN